MQEGRFSRLIQFLGPEGFHRLQQARVAVVGLGAVGSYTTEGLARAGVGRLRLVDFDVVRPSNINRQLYALESTLGLSKAELARRRVQDINPACQVQALNLFVHVETLPEVLASPIDVLVDAIDSYRPKVELLSAARAQGIPIVSCMGAALRTDPSCIHVGPLCEATECPLARRVRKELRRRGVALDFTCVYSTEPLQHLRPGVVSHDRPEEDVQRGRKRAVLGSLPTLTGIFGLIAAHTAFRIILGDAFPCSAPPRHPKELHSALDPGVEGQNRNV